MYMGTYVQYMLFVWDFNKTYIFGTDLKKIPRFNKKPSSGQRVVSYERADWQIDEQTDTHAEASSRFSQFCEGV